MVEAREVECRREQAAGITGKGTVPSESLIKANVTPRCRKYRRSRGTGAPWEVLRDTVRPVLGEEDAS